MKIELSPTKRKLQELLSRSNADRDEWRRRAGDAERRVLQLEAKIRELESHEPPEAERDCTKVRLHDRTEAEAWIWRIVAKTKEDPSSYHVYRCKECPEHPLVGQFWHVGHIVPSWKRVLKEKAG